MSFYLLFLTYFPCGDRQECNVKSEVNISAFTGHDGHDHDNEACTPFCSCSCCPASAFYTSFAKASFVKPVIQSQEFHNYDITFNTEVHISIWQPPQLAV